MWSMYFTVGVSHSLKCSAQAVTKEQSRQKLSALWRDYRDVDCRVKKHCRFQPGNRTARKEMRDGYPCKYRHVLFHSSCPGFEGILTQVRSLEVPIVLSVLLDCLLECLFSS